MDVNILKKKLEAYEQLAYQGGYGMDWLSDIGEGLKFYVIECGENNIKPTFEGFVAYVDNKAKDALEINMTINFSKK